MSMTMAQLCLPERCFLSVGSLVKYINHTSLSKTYVSTARRGNLQKGEGTLCQRGDVHSHSIHCSDLYTSVPIDQIPMQQPNFVEIPHLALQVPIGTKEAACGYGAVASTSGFAKETGLYLYPFIIFGGFYSRWWF